MRFEHPENLWFLLIMIPILLSIGAFWLWKRKVGEAMLDSRLGAVLTSSSSSRLQIARQVLVALSILLMVIASAQPQWGETNRPVKRTGIDMVFAIDLSMSMLAQDAAPDRLRAAKTEIESTLKALNGDRVGLVVFTSVSFQQSPLTADYGAIRFYLSKLKPHLMPRGGTSVGQAIIDSVELLTHKKRGSSKAEAEPEREIHAKNQIIVLITDGEDHESDPLAAAKVAADEGVQILTVGIGSLTGEKIPIVRKNGRIAGYKKDATGNLILSKLDEKSLKEIAATTNGNYVHYDGPNSISNAVISYVDTLEKSEIESMLKARYKERFYFFLVPAFILLFISLVLGDRKKLLPNKANVFLVLVALVTLSCDRPFESTLASADRGNAEIEKERYQIALDHYKKAEKEIPSRPELHFNIGRAHLGLESLDDARREYARALETQDKHLEFSALNNLGLILAAQEDWKNAHETFSQALDLATKNRTQITDAEFDETRWNLELAFRHLFPPCSVLEDSHEEDDTAETASPITEQEEAPPSPTDDGPTQKKEEVKYSLCGGDEDWFSIPAIPGTTVSITATFSDLRKEPDSERAFLVENEDVVLSILNTDGTKVAIEDRGSTSDLKSAIEKRTFSREITKFVVQPEMIDSAGEVPVVKLKLEAKDGLEFSYQLEVISIPPCYALQEKSENNNEINQAAPLETGSNPLHTCPGDEDWFWVDLAEGDSLFVDVQPQKDEQREIPPQLRVDIFDTKTERMVALNIEEAGIVTAGIRESKKAGRFAVRVSGVDRNQQGPYSLDLYKFSSCANEDGQKLPEGDDRLEENDEANSASTLDMKLPVHRYLRQCPEDPDFYKLEFEKDAKDKSIKMGVALTSFPRNDGESTNFDFDLVSATGDVILVGGTPIEQPQNDAEKSPMPLHRGVFSEPLEEQQPAILRAHNGNDFYHLIQLNPQQPPQQQDQDQESKPEDEKDENEKEDDEKKEDSDEKKENDPSEDEDKKEEEKDKEEENEGNEKKDDAKPEEKEEKENPELQRIEDLLEALEQNDDNFQLRKALEKVPKRLIEKDW